MRKNIMILFILLCLNLIFGEFDYRERAELSDTVELQSINLKYLNDNLTEDAFIFPYIAFGTEALKVIESEYRSIRNTNIDSDIFRFNLSQRQECLNSKVEVCNYIQFTELPMVLYYDSTKESLEVWN